MKRIFTLTALLCLFMMMGINAAVAQSSNFTATFSYNSESNNLVGSSSPVGVFGNASYTCGTNLSTNGKKTNGDKTIFRFKNKGAISKDGYDSEKNGVTFTYSGIAGTTYTPSHIHLEAATSGTNGFSLQIEVSVGGNRKVVATNLGLKRIDDSNNPGVSILDYDISGLSASGDVSVILTVNNQSNPDKSVGFNNIELKGTYKTTSTTTIKSSSEMTKSTTVPTTWDFSDESKWSSTVKALNTYTSEWTATGSNEWRPTTVCKNREYNLELINGLVFNTNDKLDLCLDNSNKQLSVAKGSSITIPGLSSGNYVRFTGSISGITTPENATLISSDGSYLYKINSNGDVKFEIPTSLTTWGVWIKSIEVLASAPVNKTTILISDLDIENNKSANNGFDRQVAGFNIDFAGGQGLKSHNDGTNGNGTYIQLRHYSDKDGKTSDGSIKVSAVDPTVKITKLRFNLDNTHGNSADEQLSFDAAGGNIENMIEGDHAQITDLSAQGWSGITLSYKGTDDSKGIHIKSIEIETDKPVSSEAVTPVLSQALQLVDKNGSKTIDGGISSGDNANWLYSGKFTLTSSNTSIATCNGNTIKGVGTGTATITVKYTPTNSSYFNAVTSTFTIRVRGDAVTQKVWIFDKNLNGSEGKGIGNGQTFSSDVWTSSNKDGVTSYSLANATKDDENGANLITADGTTVFRTDGISFVCEVPGHLSVVPDNSLTLDGNGTIVLNDIASSVNKGASTYVLIEAEPVSGRAGFIVNSKNWNSNFVNQELTAASTRQTFMLKVTSQKNQQTVDVKIQPSAAMKIYRIEVTQRTIPTISATVTGKISTETKGSKTTYQARHGDSFTVTFNITKSDLNGKFKVYAMDDNKIVSGNTVEQDVVSGTAGSATFDATAVGGGEALFVAKFIPDATETKYTYGYATVSVDVADPTMYRVKNGESAEVGQKVTDVEGITMYFGGWNGETNLYYHKPDSKGNPVKDEWGEADRKAYIETFTGYDYTFSANENSADETLTQYANKFTANYNKDKYWYKEDVNNPYSMPVFGGFLKFVPNENGTLKVYIHQNGALCEIRHKDGSQTINPFMVHTRSYYIADETGKLYTGTDGVTATTKAKWADVWNGTKIGDGLGKSLGKGRNETKASFDDDDNTDYDAENKQYKEDIDYWRDRVKDINGNSEDNVGENLVQTIYNLDGGWVMLNEGASEYSFHVTAGKTYFVFTNRTKLGFYGFRFTSDKNVTEVTIKPSAEDATSYTLTKSSEPAAGASVAYKVDQSFKRELNAGMWNTLCLPFSLNEDQTKAALPEGFEIVDFYSVKNDKLTFKKHYYQMIDAGRPYLIWIPGTLGEKYDMKFPTGYVAYDDKTSGLNPINVNGEDDSADKYVWTGTYQQMSLPENAYFVAQNPDNGKTVIKQNVSGKSQTKGYRAYLVAASGVTPVKALSIDYDGVDEEVTTGIDDIMADLTDPETTGKVYNLGGQLVSRNGLQSLPKGIYIMNGKKYVVK